MNGDLRVRSHYVSTWLNYALDGFKPEPAQSRHTLTDPLQTLGEQVPAFPGVPRPVSSPGRVWLSGDDQHGRLWFAGATGICMKNILEEFFKTQLWVSAFNNL